MADPILNLPDLLEGDPLGYLRQNQRNLVMARLAVDPRVVNNTATTPPIGVAQGQAWVLGGSGTGQWAGQAANTVAIALSSNPSSAQGWFFLAPFPGLRLWFLAGSPTGHVVWSGSAWVAV